MPAIEGYLGGARFNFIVPEEHEEEATSYVRDNRFKTRVIQGVLCRRSARPELVPSDSIIHELKTDHPVALAYLQEQYGQAVKVDTFEALRKTSRGVMKDGRATAGRTYFHAWSESLVFGKAQQARALEAAELAHRTAEREVSRLDEERRSLQALLALGRQNRRPSFEAATVASEAVREIARVADEVAQLDLSEVSALTAQKVSLTQLAEACDNQISEANQAIGKCRSDIAAQQLEVEQKEATLPARRQKVGDEMRRLKHLAEVKRYAFLR
ncbi:MAG: hypothetical protein QM803_18125 [Rhodocyclaceae bacterium]